MFAVVAVVIVGWGIFVINNNPFQNGSRTADDKQAGGTEQSSRRRRRPADADRQPQDDAAPPIRPTGREARRRRSSCDGRKIGLEQQIADAGRRHEKCLGIDVPVIDEVEEDSAPVSKQATALAATKKRTDTDAAADKPDRLPATDESDSPPAAVAALPSKYISPEGVIAALCRQRRSLVPAPPGRRCIPATTWPCPIRTSAAWKLTEARARHHPSAVLCRCSQSPDPVISASNSLRQFVVRPAGVADDPPHCCGSESESPANCGWSNFVRGRSWACGSIPWSRRSSSRCSTRMLISEPSTSLAGAAAITDPEGQVHEIKSLDCLELPCLRAWMASPPNRDGSTKCRNGWDPSLSSADQNYARLLKGSLR